MEDSQSTDLQPPQPSQVRHLFSRSDPCHILLATALAHIHSWIYLETERPVVHLTQFHQEFWDFAHFLGLCSHLLISRILDRQRVSLLSTNCCAMDIATHSHLQLSHPRFLRCTLEILLCATHSSCRLHLRCWKLHLRPSRTRGFSCSPHLHHPLDLTASSSNSVSLSFRSSLILRKNFDLRRRLVHIAHDSVPLYLRTPTAAPPLRQFRFSGRIRCPANIRKIGNPTDSTPVTRGCLAHSSAGKLQRLLTRQVSTKTAQVPAVVRWIAQRSTEQVRFISRNPSQLTFCGIAFQSKPTCRHILLQIQDC